MFNRMMTWTALLAMVTGCPHTWGKEGYVQRLSYENIRRNQPRFQYCTLIGEDWVSMCGDETDHNGTCPEACPLPSDINDESQ